MIAVRATGRNRWAFIRSPLIRADRPGNRRFQLMCSDRRIEAPVSTAAVTLGDLHHHQGRSNPPHALGAADVEIAVVRPARPIQLRSE